jgi:sugar lactone lactonase YvrE
MLFTIRIVLTVVMVSIFALTTTIFITDANANTANNEIARESEFIVRFNANKKELPEGLAVYNDRIYVDMAPTQEIFSINADGSYQLYGQLPKVSEGNGFSTGLAFDKQGNLYAALASFTPDVTTGIYRIPPGGGDAVLFASDPAMQFPNDLKFDREGNLFVSDSLAASIFRIDAIGKVEAWIEDNLLVGDRSFCGEAKLDFDLGVNGFAITDDGTIYAVLGDRASIVKIPKLGNKAGAVSAIAGPDCKILDGADGLVADSIGNLYVAANRSNSLVKVSQDGKLSVLEKGSVLDFPASVALINVDGKESLLVTNFGLLSAMNKDKTPEVGVLSYPI